MFWAVRKENVATPFCSPKIFQASIAVRLLQKNYIKFPNMKPPEKFSSFDRFVEASNEMDHIPESIRAVEMMSKSQKKTYTLREVLGSQIGRVQYFLNRELSFLLNCGKITSIQG